MVRRIIVCAVLLSCACGSAPAPDTTHAYTSLVHSYYLKYDTARGAAYYYCVVGTDVPLCRDRGTLMIAVWQSFLKDLDRTPAPSKFATDDRAIRKQLPVGIGDLQTMVAAAAAGNHDAMVKAGQTYIDDMVPIVTDALHHIDPVWPQE